MDDIKLIDEFVAAFEKLDHLLVHRELDPIAWEMSYGEPNEYGKRRWRPAQVAMDRNCLAEVYRELPARLPPVYEKLVLRYRWAEVDLATYRLLANPLGEGLSGLLGAMKKDPFLWDALIRSGCIPFGKGPDCDYDPVCFDLRKRRKGGDCRIVKFDHEEILCNNRVKEVAELAPSFRSLIEQTIAASKRVPSV